jgi:hypothetical protein
MSDTVFPDSPDTCATSLSLSSISIPVSWESDFSDDEQTPTGQFEDIVTGSDWDINNNEPNLPQQNTEPRSSSLNDPRNTVCPIRGSVFTGGCGLSHMMRGRCIFCTWCLFFLEM